MALLFNAALTVALYNQVTGSQLGELYVYKPFDFIVHFGKVTP